MKKARLKAQLAAAREQIRLERGKHAEAEQAARVARIKAFPIEDLRPYLIDRAYTIEHSTMPTGYSADGSSFRIQGPARMKVEIEMYSTPETQAFLGLFR